MIVRVLEGAFEVEEVVLGIEVGWRQVIGRIRMRLQKSARLYALDLIILCKFFSSRSSILVWKSRESKRPVCSERAVAERETITVSR
jgi:hypothetical protein